MTEFVKDGMVFVPTLGRYAHPATAQGEQDASESRTRLFDVMTNEPEEKLDAVTESR